MTKPAKKKTTKRSAPPQGHTSDSKPPINLVAVGERLEKHYGENQFNEVDVEVEIDFNDEEIGPKTKKEDVTEVDLTFSAVPFDEDYFNHEQYIEDLWRDVCDVMGWRGKDAEDGVLAVRHQSWREPLPSVRGKVVVAWRTSDQLHITLSWTPGTDAGRKRLAMLHGS
jgi:hypothetical protein